MLAAKDLMITGAAHLPVAFDTTGVGSHPGAATTSASWAHNAATNAWVIASLCTANVSTSITAFTYGSLTMNFIASQAHANTAANGSLYFYGVKNTLSGSQTVSASWTGSAFLAGNSVSYKNVGSVSGTVVKNNGNSTSGSSTLLTNVANGMLVQSFGAYSVFTVTFSAYSGTGLNSRSNLGGSGDAAMIIGDSASATSTETVTLGSTPWSSIGIILLPA